MHGGAVAAIVITVLILAGWIGYLMYYFTRSTICGVDTKTANASSTFLGREGVGLDKLFDGNPNTGWHSKTDVYREDGSAKTQVTDLTVDKKVSPGQWITCELHPCKSGTIYGYTMQERKWQNGYGIGHPKSWTIIASYDKGDTWQTVQKDDKDEWMGKLKMTLKNPVSDATHIGIIVHSVSGTSMVPNPTFCSFHGLDFHC